MTSTIVPPVDLVPGVPSRVVTVSTVDLPEGTPVDATFTFALSSHLDARADGKIIASGAKTITLSGGEGRIRLPVYSPAAKTPWGSDDWSVLVTSSIGYCKSIRVPAGSSTISLAAIPEARPLTWEEQRWALTGAGITIVEGSQWGASVSLDGGVLRFVLTVPPGGTAWWKGMLGTSANIDTLEDGAYGFFSGAAAGEVGMPEALTGVLESYQTAGVQVFNVRTTGEQRTWQRSRSSSGWTGWQRVDAGSWYKGNLDEQTGKTLSTLDAGLYLVRYVGTAEAWGLPQRLIGQLEVVDAGTQRRIRFTPNDAGAGWGDKYAWELATNSNGVLRDRWQRVDKTIMRTSPVVLTGPAGEYPQSNSRGSVRLPFTVPTGVSRVRVHMRPWNFRTRKEWGPARMRGVMIAQQSSGGGITGSRWYAPNVDGQIVTGSEEWVSDWFYVGLVPGNTYLLSYGAEWQDDVRDLVMGTCWSSFELNDWDTDGPVNYQTGWGQFGLQPMDIWIECEAPSSVPVWGYYGSSNTVGVSSGDAVFGAYANVHARKNGAFAAITAAGGWSLMDETMHDSAIINRLGYPARMLDRVYLDLGANIEARDATAAEAIAEMERWMNTRLNTLGNPPVYLLTQISRYTSEDTTDTAGTLSDWNEWIRYEATKRPEVVGLIDQAAIFADPEKPWTARVELRASPTDVHFSAMGQKLRAAALDGEIHLPMVTARDASETDAGVLAAYIATREA